MEKRTPMNQAKSCKGCGGEIPPRTRNGGFTKVWCSQACRTRTNYRNNAGIRARAAELRAQHHRDTYIPVGLHSISCGICDVEFQARTTIARYCSSRCKSAAFTAARKADGRAKAYRKQNVDRHRAYMAEYGPKWRASDAGKAALQLGWARRRAVLEGADVERFEHKEIFDRDDWICQLCTEPVDQECPYPDPLSASLDHVVPISHGGGHLRANVQLAHLICNMRKGNRAA